MAPAPRPRHAQPLGVAPRKRGLVPYITAWSSEQKQPSRLVSRRGRLAYLDEQSYDRDRHGILWHRTTSSPGKGTPEFGRVHTARQRRAMQRTLCQVCGAAADASEDGVLWLMSRREYEREPWPAPIESPQPPVCLGCAVLAVKRCPHLADHYTAVRVQHFRLSGVHGALYAPGPTPRVLHPATLALDDPRVCWLTASQLIMRLLDYRVVDLGGEAAAHGLSL